MSCATIFPPVVVVVVVVPVVDQHRVGGILDGVVLVSPDGSLVVAPLAAAVSGSTRSLRCPFSRECKRILK
jgi:hypothetical protein